MTERAGVKWISPSHRQSTPHASARRPARRRPGTPSAGCRPAASPRRRFRSARACLLLFQLGPLQSDRARMPPRGQGHLRSPPWRRPRRRSDPVTLPMSERACPAGARPGRGGRRPWDGARNDHRPSPRRAGLRSGAEFSWICWPPSTAALVLSSSSPATAKGTCGRLTDTPRTSQYFHIGGGAGRQPFDPEVAGAGYEALIQSGRGSTSFHVDTGSRFIETTRRGTTSRRTGRRTCTSAHQSRQGPVLAAVGGDDQSTMHRALIRAATNFIITRSSAAHRSGRHQGQKIVPRPTAVDVEHLDLQDDPQPEHPEGRHHRQQQPPREGRRAVRRPWRSWRVPPVQEMSSSS